LTSGVTLTPKSQGQILKWPYLQSGQPDRDETNAK